MRQRIFSQNDPFKHPAMDETLFSLANGYLGVRACRSEMKEGAYSQGSYVNGFYDRIPMVHAEMAVGFPTEIDKLVRIIDTQTMLIYLDGELVTPDGDNTSNYKHEFLLDQGVVVRSFDYKIGDKIAHIRMERMASLWEPSLFVYHIDITYDGTISIRSLVECQVQNFVDPSDPRVGSYADRMLLTDSLSAIGPVISYRGRTANTGAKLLVQVHHLSNQSVNSVITGETVTTAVQAEGVLRLEKRVYVSDSYHYTDPQGALSQAIERAKVLFYEDLRQKQTEIVEAFWAGSAIEIFEGKELSDTVAYLQYQLFQNAPRFGSGNIAAKGLSGEGYEGHYFWDSEIFLLPVLEWLTPDLARPLLAYRYSILDQARERSLIMGHTRGACYPWRTISGIECSGYYPAGSAQYHLSADIAHAVMQRYLIHHDMDFLADMGAEILIETARLWLEVGHFHENQFHIFNVTGPDEYTAVVNDNYYTNRMAKENLLNAIKVYYLLEESKPEALKTLVEKIGFDPKELSDFQKAADQMVLLYDEKLGIHAQDDSFLQKPRWDMRTHGHLRPLLLHVHPLTIYRHQVLKQADTVLAYTMVEENEEIMRRSFHYYEELTTHDSSLSRCSYGIMASRLGDLDKAYAYFLETLMLDVHDMQGNTKDGLHMANVAGALLSVITGFAGLRAENGQLSLRPKCPKQLSGYSFPFSFQGRRLKLTYQGGYRLELLYGDPLDIDIDGERIRLNDVLEGGQS